MIMMYIVIGNLLMAIGTVLHFVAEIFKFLLIAKAILSWVNPDPFNPIVQFINNSTDPLLSRIRQYVPPLGMFDMSVLVALVAIFFLDISLVGTLMDFGRSLKLGIA